MSTVTGTVLVRRSVEEVAKIATDPDVVLPIIGGFGRFALIRHNPDGSQEWDLFLHIGTVHVGGRILVGPPSDHALTWRSLRGKAHTARIEVRPAGDHAQMSISVTTQFVGAVTGRLTGLLARSILARQIDAGLQQLRHYIEYGP